MTKLCSAAVAAVVLFTGSALVRAEDKKEEKVPAVLNFKMTTLDGKTADLSKYQGKVVVFVNVASKCGFTPQYEALEKLHEKYADKGLVIVGVPANNFGKQEPGSNEDIAEFCKSKYSVKFDMLAKVSVVGLSQIPFALLLDVVLFDHEINWVTLLGMALVLAPTTWLLLRGLTTPPTEVDVANLD